jgi:hypothetical protein
LKHTVSHLQTSGWGTVTAPAALVARYRKRCDKARARMPRLPD